MLLPLAALLTTASAATLRPPKLQNLVTFGDSYTDEGRLVYMFNNHKTPPPGVLLPSSNETSSGGYAWPRYVANQTKATLYDYAVGGAMCSSSVINRRLDAIDGDFPSVMEYEVPTFKNDLSYKSLYPNRRADNTVYSLWIGTNDLGADGFLRGKQQPGKTITSYIDCIWSFFDQIYETGGRRFILMNQAPLHLSPMYAPESQGGTGNNEYWGNKTSYDEAEYQDKILEYTTSVNTLFDYGVPFQLRQKRWPGASISVFDVHSLMLDVRADPSRYLDSPANVTASWRVCFQGCVESSEPKSAFMWYDEVHPSERMQQIFAKHFIDVVNQDSTYGAYYRG